MYRTGTFRSFYVFPLRFLHHPCPSFPVIISHYQYRYRCIGLGHFISSCVFPRINNYLQESIIYLLKSEICYCFSIIVAYLLWMNHARRE